MRPKKCQFTETDITFKANSINYLKKHTARLSVISNIFNPSMVKDFYTGLMIHEYFQHFYKSEE